jgi:hypothetical protein
VVHQPHHALTAATVSSSFSDGLAVALGDGWDWEPALTLANACATYYVENGDTGDRESLREFLDGRRA